MAVVTGASRGAGRGIAAALADRDWRVYATSRTINDAPPGGVAVRVDHGDDDAVAALFDRVQRENRPAGPAGQQRCGDLGRHW